MASIFISHSSRDNEPTVKIATWLRRLGYDDIFLDLDKNDGISPGMNWKGELAAAMKRSQVVLLLVSDNWFASVWCQAEHATAVMMGKQIVPAILSAPREADWVQLRQAIQEKLGDLQFADLTQDWDEGLARLEVVLDHSRVTPLAFSVPEGAAPYRGLRAYTADEAGLFFARQRETQELFEQLRQLAAPASAERLLVILGASGAGKSSLLRAGLWPQLELRRREWLPLEPMIPEQNAFSGTTPALALARAIADTFGRYGNPCNPADIVRLLESTRLDEAFSGIADELRTLAGGSQATVVLGIDQAEELLRATAVEQTKFFSLLKGFLAGTGHVALLAIRSDTFDEVQEQRLLEGIPFADYLVAPMPLARIPEVIRGPAERVGLRVDDALVDQATEDAKTGDALPLLSFTLERLWRDHAREGELTADAYETLASTEGGVRISPVENSVRLAAEEAIGRIDAEAENALAEAFVPGLVDLTDGLAPVRRRAPWAFMPEKAIPLLKKLVEARLLTSGGGKGEDGGEANTLEVSHEALLRRWPMLVARIEAAKPDLRRLQEVERAAADWLRARNANPKDGRAELAHQGRRLASARKLVRRPEWRHRLGASGVAYLEACGGAQRQRRMMAAAFLMVAAAIVGVILQTDFYAVQRMLRKSPRPEDQFKLDKGRASVLVLAGLSHQALKEIQHMPNGQDAELCDTGLRLLDVGKREDAKDFINRVLSSNSFKNQALYASSRKPSEVDARECINAAFLVGLGDQAIKVLAGLLAEEEKELKELPTRDSPVTSVMEELKDAFVISSTDKQFSEGLSQATNYKFPGPSLRVFDQWLKLAPKTRSLQIAASLPIWRSRHPLPSCGAEPDATIADSKPGFPVDDLDMLVRRLVALGFRGEAQKLGAYDCSAEKRASNLSSSAAEYPQARAGQQRADWLAWSSREVTGQNPELPMQGKCDALEDLLYTSRIVPESEHAFRRLLKSVKRSECDKVADQRAHLTLLSGQWPFQYLALRRTQVVLREDFAGQTLKRRLYWEMIQALSISSYGFPYLERLIQDRGHFLPVPQLGEKALKDPLLAALVQNSPGAPFPELPLESVRVNYNRNLNGVCVQVLTGLGRAYLGRVAAAREGIARGQKMIGEEKSQPDQSLPDDQLLQANRCIAEVLTAIREYDEAEAIATAIAENRKGERDNVFRDIALQQAGYGDFKRARDTASKISVVPNQHSVETEVLLIWSETKLGRNL